MKTDLMNKTWITVYRTPRTKQLSWEDVLNCKYPFFVAADLNNTTTSATETRVVDHINYRLSSIVNHRRFTSVMLQFMSVYQDLYAVEDKQTLYKKGYIPKKSGGLREINAPCERLKGALREMIRIFTEEFKMLHHTAAFAYVKGRSTYDCMKKHQMNNSRWYLKTDFSDFFGSTTKNFVLDMISHIYPLSCYVTSQQNRDILSNFIDIAFLNGGLPQGSPASPFLTNLMMVPIDHTIRNELIEAGFIYTRYADDIQISHRKSFMFTEKVNYINAVLERFDAPFKIKREKTRYGSSAGSNFNLGLMINKDNDITIGRKRKHNIQCAVHNFLRDYKNGIHWDCHDIQVLSGSISYMKMIEPQYTDGYLSYVVTKTGYNLLDVMRKELGLGTVSEPNFSAIPTNVFDADWSGLPSHEDTGCPF